MISLLDHQKLLYQILLNFFFYAYGSCNHKDLHDSVHRELYSNFARITTAVPRDLPEGIVLVVVCW